MTGIWPENYHANPNPNKPIEQIWDDLDGYSFEEMYEEPDHYQSIRFYAPLPPLLYQGHFIKGILFTQAAHLLIEFFPKIKDLFFVCANTMCSAYPWARNADCYFTCYRNPARERYYKSKYPETKNIVFIPLQDADFTNERVMTPIPDTPKTIDIFCVSTAFPVKNVPLFAQALKVYEKKYGHRLKVVYTIGDHDAKRNEDGSFDYSGVSDYSKNVLREVDAVLGDMQSYIDFYPYIDYYTLPTYYSAAKCGVLASLIEGKNRFINECISCNTPIIIFKDLNKFSRSNTPAFFGNAGECVPEFSAESLADTIHKVLMNPSAYEPRQNYLKYNGRRNFINTMLWEIPYYRENLPEFAAGDALNNDWLNKACIDNYEIDYESFLYDKNFHISNIVGLDNIRPLLQYYYGKFNIPWHEVPSECHTPLR